MRTLLPQDFSDSSRVWIYQCNRPFWEKEIEEINMQLEMFYVQWQSHGTPVKGWAKVVYNQFIVVMADEAQSGVSGCSTDGMVRIIKSIERQYSVQLFDRLTLSFFVNGKVQMLPIGQVQYAVDKGYINGDTLFFNNAIETKEALEKSWLVPLKDSWLAGRLNLAVE
jgi:hypothetical protein